MCLSVLTVAGCGSSPQRCSVITEVEKETKGKTVRWEVELKDGHEFYVPDGKQNLYKEGNRVCY